MKFIHIADVHANKNRIKPCLSALKQIRDFIFTNSKSKKDAPPLLIAGDFWDATITNTENSGFTQYIDIMGEIAALTEVFMVAGTPSHDVASSLKVFKPLGIHLFEEPGIEDMDGYTIYAIPEPRKSNYIVSSQHELNERILQDLRNSIDIFKSIKEQKTNPINILMYHGEVTGSIYQNGVKVQETSYAMPGVWLKELDMDYIALGHIHLDQQIESVGHCYYAGSVAPIDFGEQHNAGFNLIDIEVDE